MNVPGEAAHASPSFTLKVKVTAPFALATGTYVRPPRLPTAISCPVVTSCEAYLRVPVAGRVVMSTVTSASPESTSVYPQSLAVVVKVYVASSFGVALPPVVDGASLVFDITMSKSSVTERVPAPLSVAVTLIVIVPTPPFRGVPLNVLVPALKLSQLSDRVESALPFDSAAV